MSGPTASIAAGLSSPTLGSMTAPKALPGDKAHPSHSISPYQANKKAVGALTYGPAPQPFGPAMPASSTVPPLPPSTPTSISTGSTPLRTTPSGNSTPIKLSLSGLAAAAERRAAMKAGTLVGPPGLKQTTQTAVLTLPGSSNAPGRKSNELGAQTEGGGGGGGPLREAKMPSSKEGAKHVGALKGSQDQERPDQRYQHHYQQQQQQQLVAHIPQPSKHTAGTKFVLPTGKAHGGSESTQTSIPSANTHYMGGFESANAPTTTPSMGPPASASHLATSASTGGKMPASALSGESALTMATQMKESTATQTPGGESNCSYYLYLGVFMLVLVIIVIILVATRSSGQDMLT